MGFDEMVHAVSFLAVFIVDHGIVEIIHVPAGLPGGGVHKDGRIDTNDVFVELGHGFPPGVADVLFELGTVLAIVVHSAEAVIYFAALKNVSVFFGVANEVLKCVCFVCHEKNLKMCE